MTDHTQGKWKAEPGCTDTDQDYTEQFDRLAEEFYKQFRLYAPGKDVAAAVGEENYSEYKHKFFHYWLKAEADKAVMLEALERAEESFALLREQINYKETMTKFMCEVDMITDDEYGGAEEGTHHNWHRIHENESTITAAIELGKKWVDRL